MQTIEEELGAEFGEEMPKEPYFVDFLREAPEVTGKQAFRIGAIPSEIHIASVSHL